MSSMRLLLNTAANHSRRTEVRQTPRSAARCSRTKKGGVIRRRAPLPSGVLRRCVVVRVGVASVEVASTRAKQSSRGRGTTEYENRLAPRGAGGQSIRLQPHTSDACRFFTCRRSRPDGNPEFTGTPGIFFFSSCPRRDRGHATLCFANLSRGYFVSMRGLGA
jgi:hypothetical protein